MTALTAPERLLQDLGVTDPDDIDLEAIAWTMGAEVRYRPLDGCEARILGRDDRKRQPIPTFHGFDVTCDPIIPEQNVGIGENGRGVIRGA